RRINDYVFPGPYRAHMSLSTLRLLLRRMCRRDATGHGFRSTFSTWARETTNFPREIVEAALGHVIGDAADRAYARTDLFERRRALMMQWSGYCDRKDAQIIAFRA